MLDPQYSQPGDEDLINSRELRRMFGGVSEMTIWRWLQSETVGFPKPIVISGKNYWLSGDLRRFRERCSTCAEKAAPDAAKRLCRRPKTAADAQKAASTERAAS